MISYARRRAESMRILSIDRFFDVVGGKERYVAEWAALMREHGHTVHLFATRPPGAPETPGTKFLPPAIETNARGPLRRMGEAARRMYNVQARDMLARMLDERPVDIAHVHSIFHLSASVIDELRRRAIPIVWTLHDYHPICPISILYVHDAVCEACRGGRFHNAILKRCSRGDVGISALNAGEAYLNRLRRTYQAASVFIAPSRFVLDKFVDFGWSPSRLVHVPHFGPTRAWTAEPIPERGPIVFAGRLQRQKGVHVLLDALARLNLPIDQELVVVGDGPERSVLEAQAERLMPGRVQFVGHQDYEGVRAWYRRSRFAVVPSVWYEVFGLSVVEPFAVGRPVIGSRIGGIPEVIEDGRSGLLVTPGDPVALADAIDWLLSHPVEAAAMGAAARERAESAFGPGAHYNHLLRIYENALRR
ncbi:MAG: glycosyltransferase [Thermoflexales bacterium]|nr:glycosyltransferase [Thermoflexales bacterium]MBP8240954.1 glycosyltransferase [Thermoflexales bacterium]